MLLKLALLLLLLKVELGENIEDMLLKEGSLKREAVGRLEKEVLPGIVVLFNASLAVGVLANALLNVLLEVLPKALLEVFPKALLGALLNALFAVGVLPNALPKALFAGGVLPNTFSILNAGTFPKAFATLAPGAIGVGVLLAGVPAPKMSLFDEPKMAKLASPVLLVSEKRILINKITKTISIVLALLIKKMHHDQLSYRSVHTRFQTIHFPCF